jgi:hypothetical protein
VLEATLINDRFDSAVSLRIENEGREYLGTFVFDAFGFCYEIYSLLRSCGIGSIQEIGDIDLSSTL